MIISITLIVAMKIYNQTYFYFLQKKTKSIFFVCLALQTTLNYLPSCLATSRWQPKPQYYKKSFVRIESLNCSQIRECKLKLTYNEIIV